MEKTKRAQMDLVNTVMIHKATAKPCKVLAQTSADSPAQIIYTVEFKDRTKLECRQNELAFYDTIEDRIRAEALFATPTPAAT
jgi:hypothetical protein